MCRMEFQDCRVLLGAAVTHGFVALDAIHGTSLEQAGLKTIDQYLTA